MKNDQIDFYQIGKRIKYARMSKGLTQEQLAEIVNCTPPHISAIEHGKKAMSFHLFLAIVNVLEISTDMILFGYTNTSENILDGCNPLEKKIICNIVDVLKKTLRDENK